MAGYDEFVDPNSAIARIIAQMQGAANRSNPELQPGGAQPGPVGTGPGMPSQMGEMQGQVGPEDPQALIERLLAGQVNQ